MFIIIEGTDASGKSTLVDAVKAELAVQNPDKDVTLYHKSKPAEPTRRCVLSDYVTSVENIKFGNYLSLADRWHWGEVTYAPLKRPETNKDGYGLLGKAGWRWTELFLASRGAAQFWLHQPLDVITQRLSQRGDDYVQIDELGAILSQYKFAVSQICDISILSPSPDSLDEVPQLAKMIVSTAKDKSDRAQALANFPEYIGVPRPKVLLVGDRRNITKRYGEETKLPFMPVDGNSGEFILNALPDDFWKLVGFINISEFKYGKLTPLLTALGFPRIVALGRLAEKGLIAHGMIGTNFSVVPHPQFVRRFANSRRDEYGEAIARLSMNNDKEDRWTLR
jgi:hypothetical protein